MPELRIAFSNSCSSSTPADATNQRRSARALSHTRKQRARAHTHEKKEKNANATNQRRSAWAHTHARKNKPHESRPAVRRLNQAR
eukprot:3119368-Rhodomonas_salina.2